MLGGKKQRFDYNWSTTGDVTKVGSVSAAETDVARHFRTEDETRFFQVDSSTSRHTPFTKQMLGARSVNKCRYWL